MILVKMNSKKIFTNFLINVKNHIREDTFDSVFWLVNRIPTFAGFSVIADTVYAPFWILHFTLLVYVYGIGNTVYQVLYAEEAGDYIRSDVNVSIFLQLFNISHWFLKNRSVLKLVIMKAKHNDELAKTSPAICIKHERLLCITKRIIWIFYAVNYINLFTSYLPNRIALNDDFAMTPCPGMSPLDATPKKEICIVILLVQELTIVTVALNYQTLQLFLISHTAAMYLILSDELMNLNTVKLENTDAHGKLISILHRHILTLDIVDKIKSLYSTPLGVNFASNALCMALFCYLPIEQWMTFMPIIMYCFLVFFLYCLLCQRLTNAAEEFERAVYSCGWERFEVSEQRIVYLMLIQAQQKVELLAANIIPVNIYTFAVTLQTMFKFVTVVKF